MPRHNPTDMEIGQPMLKQGITLQFNFLLEMLSLISKVYHILPEKRADGKSRKKEMFTNIILFLPKGSKTCRCVCSLP